MATIPAQRYEVKDLKLADDGRRMIEWAAQEAKRPVQILERRGAARDHPALVGVPETDYLKAWFLLAP